MHRPRNVLRSLLAATCGATFLTAAVLGTGTAAFAEAGDAPSIFETTTDAAADAGASPVAPAGAEAPLPDEPPTDFLSEGDTRVTDAGGADPSADDSQALAPVDPQPVDGDQDVARPDAEETVPSPAAARVEKQDEELAGPSAVPQEIVYTPSLSIDLPESVAEAGDLHEFTVTVRDYDLEQADSLVVTLPVGGIWFDLQYREGRQWVDVPFENRIIDHRAEIPLNGPEMLFRIGVSEQRLRDNHSRTNEFSALSLTGEGLRSSAMAETQVRAIELLAQLALAGAPVGTEELISVPVLSPTLEILSELPDEVSAGDTLDFVVEVTNETGYSYQPSSLIRLFYPLMVLTADEEDLLDEIDQMLNRSDLTEADLEWIDATVDKIFTLQPGEAQVSCSIDGGPAERLVVGTETPWGFRSGAYLDLWGLALGSAVVECAITVGENVPDGTLLLDSRLTLGKEGFSLAYDPMSADGLFAVGVVGADTPAEPPAKPAPQPAPAQPSPVRPAPTPSKPPAAAPVRQVPATALPKTGTDPLPLAAAGVGLVLAGAAALLGGRRRVHN
jgi:LPXTG-motif cell wall-anchored protein